MLIVQESFLNASEKNMWVSEEFSSFLRVYSTVRCNGKQNYFLLLKITLLKSLFNHVSGKDSSSSSSQPDIVTIPERIVTISAKTSLSPSSTISDMGPQSFTPPTVTFHGVGKQLANIETIGQSLSNERNHLTGTPPTVTSYEPGKQVETDQKMEQGPAGGDEKYFEYGTAVERSFMGECTGNESQRIPPALPRDRFEKEPEDKIQGQGQALPTRFQGLHKVCAF